MYKKIFNLLIFLILLFSVGCSLDTFNLKEKVKDKTSQPVTESKPVPTTQTSQNTSTGSYSQAEKSTPGQPIPAYTPMPMVTPHSDTTTTTTVVRLNESLSTPMPTLYTLPPVPIPTAISSETVPPVEILPVPTPTGVPPIEPKFFYLSYDDSASTVGVELTKNALKYGTFPQQSWARVYEFLNFEKFDKTNQEKIGLFNVSMGLWKHKNIKNYDSISLDCNKIDCINYNVKNLYELGVHVSSPTLDKETRKNAVITLVLDVSGSMEERSELADDSGVAPTKLEIMKYGLESLVNSLKPGDIVNIIQFSSRAEVVLEGYSYNPPNTVYLDKIRNLEAISSTNLNAGIDLGYKIASSYYDASKINRVILVTDAYANTGVVDPAKISQYTKINNNEGIYFSGLGVGQNFNEAFLNQLTEAGKGTYFLIATRTEAKRAFQDRFIAMLNVAARDVHFRIDYPPFLKHFQTAAEQVSTVKSEVLPTNFSYNTSQFFLEGFEELSQEGLMDQTFKLTIEYKDPDTGEKIVEVYEKKVSDILGQNIANIKDAYTIQLLTKLIKGEITKTEVQLEVSNNLSGHSSKLFDEYINLINKFIQLKG